MATYEEDFIFSEDASQMLLNGIFQRRSINLERCPLCNHKAKVYYCKCCINTGNFSHSKKKNLERYAEKVLTSTKLCQVLRQYESNSPQELQFMLKKTALVGKVDEIKERIKNRRKVIEEIKFMILQDEENLKHRQNDLAELKERLIKAYSLNTFNYESRFPVKKLKAELDASQLSLQKCYNYNIEQLNKYIFPIVRSLGETKVTSPDPEDYKIAAIADACQTHYIKGRWVTTSDYSFEHSFRVVTANLPSSGHYSFFDDIDPDSEREQRNTSNICVGLSYIAHLVNILASLIGVSLPKKVSFRDFNEFTRDHFNEENFQKIVYKLNVNILYLCISQGVPSDRLHPIRAVPNLIELLYEKQGDIGRQGSFEISHSLLHTLHEEFTCEDSDSDSDTEFEALSSEWETVPGLLGDLPYQTVAGGRTIQDIPLPAPEVPQLSMAASSLVMSVMSFMKGFTTGSPSNK